MLEDNQLQAREGEKVLNSAGLRVEKMDQYFADVCGDENYQPPEKTQTRRDHWRSRRISYMEYYAKRETLHLGKIEYPPGFSARMHITLHSHSSISLITVWQREIFLLA